MLHSHDICLLIMPKRLYLHSCSLLNVVISNQYSFPLIARLSKRESWLYLSVEYLPLRVLPYWLHNQSRLKCWTSIMIYPTLRKASVESEWMWKSQNECAAVYNETPRIRGLVNTDTIKQTLNTIQQEYFIIQLTETAAPLFSTCDDWCVL